MRRWEMGHESPEKGVIVVVTCEPFRVSLPYMYNQVTNIGLKWL